MTEPRICYYFLKLAEGRTLLLFGIIYIGLLILEIKGIRVRGIKKLFGVASAGIRDFILAMILICILNAGTAMINPAGYGICYKVKASYTYVPAVAVLCTDEGYRTDEYGVPLFNSYDEYREWFIANHPEKAYPEHNYAYTDDELAQIACDYYNDRSTEEATGCYISQGTGVQATLTLVNDDDVILEIYEIDRDELEGSDKDGNYVYLKNN